MSSAAVEFESALIVRLGRLSVVSNFFFKNLIGHPYKRCDGIYDCVDRSDEDLCDNDFLIGTTPFIQDFTTDSPFLITGPTFAPFGPTSAPLFPPTSMIPLNLETTPSYDLLTTPNPFTDLDSWADLFGTTGPSPLPELSFTTPLFSLDDIFEKEKKKPKKVREKKAKREKKKKTTTTTALVPTTPSLNFDASLEDIFASPLFEFTTPMFQTTQPSIFETFGTMPDFATAEPQLTSFPATFSPTTEVTLDFTVPDLLFTTQVPSTTMSESSGDMDLDILQSTQEPVILPTTPFEIQSTAKVSTVYGISSFSIF